MRGRSVIDEAIAGSGRLGDLHHELEDLQRAMADPAKADDMDRILERFGDVQDEYQHLGGYELESAGARDPPRPRLRRRAHRRRRRRAVGRLEDARRDGERAPRPARRPADGRADEPPRHRVDPLARVVPPEPHRRAPHDLPRPRLHEPRRLEDRRDRRRRDHDVLGQLRLLRARARDPRDPARGRLRAAAGDAREGAALHRALRRARREGRAGAEPREEAREDRDDRAAEEAQGRALRLPGAAALGRRRRGARGRLEGLRLAQRSTTASI